MMWILTQKMLGAQGLGEQLLASSCWLETGKLRFEEGLGRARIHRLRKNALKRRSREGHDVQSCHKSSDMNVGFSRWGTLSIQKSLFPQPVQPCHREPRRTRALATEESAESFYIQSEDTFRYSISKTISAARSAGCWAASPTATGGRSRLFTSASHSSMRARAGPSGRISCSRATTFWGVKSCCTSSETTSSPAIRLTMAKRG